MTVDIRSGHRAKLSRLLAHLTELVEALDRRVPQIERTGEAGIASDAADLRTRARERILQLETTLNTRARARRLAKRERGPLPM